MVRILLFMSFSIALISCNLFSKKADNGLKSDRYLLMETDRDFSELSAEKGMKQAFLEYIDSNGVLLKANSMPIVGADAVDYLIQQNDSNYMLTWEPKSGAVAQSGDLGYTYGIYTLKPSGKDTAMYGTYVSVWKKQRDGKWKFVLDSGNEGVEDAE